MDLPDYYASLDPFKDAFLKGTPILTYHHVGRRRSGARLKGLYVSPSLFCRQLGELKQEGFQTGDFGSILGQKRLQERRVFLTFDDGFLDLHEHALPSLQKHGLKGIVFVVADLIGKTNVWQQAQGDIVEPLMNKAHIRVWLGAGMEIGSHTLTHARLTHLPMDHARDEITNSKKKLEDAFGRPVEHFCYPYGDWNSSVRDLVAEAGYRTACTTESGINTPDTSPFELKRFTVRYRSRSLKNVWSCINRLIRTRY